MLIDSLVSNENFASPKQVCKHGVHKDEIYNANRNGNRNKGEGRDGEEEVIKSMLRPDDLKSTRSSNDDGDSSTCHEEQVYYTGFNMKSVSDKQAILSNTLALCDSLGVARPTYIIEELRM